MTTFNLDEYAGLEKEHPQSCHTFVWDNFSSHINIQPERVHIPDGMAGDIPLPHMNNRTVKDFTPAQ